MSVNVDVTGTSLVQRRFGIAVRLSFPVRGIESPSSKSRNTNLWVFRYHQSAWKKRKEHTRTGGGHHGWAMELAVLRCHEYACLLVFHMMGLSFVVFRE